MSFLGRIFWAPMATKEQVERRQLRIRDAEWACIRDYLPASGRFLDIGCGAGHNMLKARDEHGLDVDGIDPDPGAHGVGRYEKERVASISDSIQQGFAEELPYADAQYDVVFSSHVLEHVQDVRQSLQEMRRVVKPEGIIIIGVPTHWMARRGLLAQWLFTSHIRLYNLFKGDSSKPIGLRIKHCFLPASHSYPLSKTVRYDLAAYRPAEWKRQLEQVLSLTTICMGPSYAYPDFPQLFPFRQQSDRGSSIFFICRPS